MKKIITNIFLILSVIVILWFAASYVEVISKNLGENPEYSFWNIFQILVNTN